jgi:hypothetical protein
MTLHLYSSCDTMATPPGGSVRTLFLLSVSLVACGGLAGEGEACEVTADCEDGLECHAEDGTMECHAEHGDDSDTDAT